MNDRTYTYSQLSSQSACQIVAAHYNLDAPLSCKFYVLGLHDNYLIQSGNQKYILRIYRNAWRSREEAGFELELLAFLTHQTDLAAKLVPTKNDELAVYIDSPEGERTAALFCYADGHAPGNNITTEEAELLGVAVANLHNITNTFTTHRHRPRLELSYLLDESITSIKPFVDSKAHSDLKQLQAKLHDALSGIEKEVDIYGICTGDVNSGNFHINQHKQITLFDFDQCGYGYRAFEIGKFFSSLHNHHDKPAICDAFLAGYTQIRQLSEIEIAAIPYFEIVSVIWVMAIHAVNVDRIGYKVLEKPFWDKRFSILQTLDSRLSDELS